MPNWTALTAENLKAAGHGALVDKARTTATGGLDPAEEAIADAVARVRGAIAAGNALDQDPRKIPNSLRGLTIRIAIFALSERIGQPLSDDQRDTRKNDHSYLLRISDQKVRFETPDDPAGSGEMQTAGGIETATRTNRGDYTRQGMSGL